MVIFRSFTAVKIYNPTNDKEMTLKWQNDSIMH